MIPSKDSPQAMDIKKTRGFRRIVDTTNPYNERSFTYPMLVAMSWLFEKDASIFSLDKIKGFYFENLLDFVYEDFPNSTKLRGSFKIFDKHNNRRIVAFGLLFPKSSVAKDKNTLALLIMKEMLKDNWHDSVEIHRLLRDPYKRHLVRIDMPYTDTTTIIKQMDAGLDDFVGILSAKEIRPTVSKIHGLSREVLISDSAEIKREFVSRVLVHRNDFSQRLLDGIADVLAPYSLTARLHTGNSTEVKDLHLIKAVMNTKVAIANDSYRYEIVLIVFYNLDKYEDLYQVSAYVDPQDDSLEITTDFAWTYVKGDSLENSLSRLISYIMFWHEQNFGTKLEDRKSSRARKISNLL